MKGKILPPNGISKFRWVVKDENKKDIIGVIVEDIWWGIEDILQNPEMHHHYHMALKKKGGK